jgi:hypothetical protein
MPHTSSFRWEIILMKPPAIARLRGTRAFGAELSGALQTIAPGDEQSQACRWPFFAKDVTFT